MGKKVSSKKLEKLGSPPRPPLHCVRPTTARSPRTRLGGMVRLLRRASRHRLIGARLVTGLVRWLRLRLSHQAYSMLNVVYPLMFSKGWQFQS